MQRKLILSLIVFSVIAAEGCRRGGVKREPISVNKEGDLIFSTKKNEFADSMRPKDDSQKITISDLNAPFEEKHLNPKNEVIFREAVKNNPDDQKAVSAASGRLADARKAYQEKLNREATFALAEVLIKYRQANKPPAYSRDDLKKYLRRQKKYDMYDDVNGQKVTVPYLVDSLNVNHVLVYHGSPEVRPDPADAKKTISYFPTVGTAGKLELLKKEDIDTRVKTQEMQVAYYYFVTYAAPHFYKQGPELRAFRDFLLANKEPFYLGADPPGSPAPVFLGKLQQRKPDLLRTPPDKRDFNRWRKYLKENAPPQLLDYIDTGTLVLDVSADLRTSGLLVACRGQPEPDPKDEFGQKKEKYHYGVNTDGQVSSQYAGSQLTGWMDLRKKEQTPANSGSGSVPGGVPPPGGMPPGGTP